MVLDVEPGAARDFVGRSQRTNGRWGRTITEWTLTAQPDFDRWSQIPRQIRRSTRPRW